MNTTVKNNFSSLFLSRGLNYISGDKPMLEILSHFGFKPDQDLIELGGYVSEEMIEALDVIDHYSKPVLHTWGLLGDRIDYVRISPDHERVLTKLQNLGVIRKMNGKRMSLMDHFVSGYAISDSGVFCTMTLTAQTAYILNKYGDPSLKKKYLGRFFDRNNPWYGATFYSEIQGGSDIGANTTIAEQDGDRFYLTGSDKYFASNAGIADAALVTARFRDSPKGAKGISLFLVPAYCDDGKLNYTIRRLKNKMGTTAVPTGEVEFNRSEAYLIGSMKEGIYLSMEALIISRIDDAIAAVGIARKALWEAYLFAEKREAFGKKLIDHDLMRKDFMELEIDLEAAAVLSILSAKYFDDASDSRPPYDTKYHFSRLLGNIAKSIAADTSAGITRYSMEMLGGIGFFEEFPMAKFHRDSIVTSIWEGTSNIQALETLEVLTRKEGVRMLHEHLNAAVSGFRDREFAKLFHKESGRILQKIMDMLSSGEQEYYSKEILRLLGTVIASAELELIGQDIPEGNGIMRLTSRLYFQEKLLGKSIEFDEMQKNLNIIRWMAEARGETGK